MRETWKMSGFIYESILRILVFFDSLWLERMYNDSNCEEKCKEHLWKKKENGKHKNHS